MTAGTSLLVVGADDIARDQIHVELVATSRTPDVQMRRPVLVDLAVELLQIGKIRGKQVLDDVDADGVQVAELGDAIARLEARISRGASRPDGTDGDSRRSALFSDRISSIRPWPILE